MSFHDQWDRIENGDRTPLSGRASWAAEALADDMSDSAHGRGLRAALSHVQVRKQRPDLDSWMRAKDGLGQSQRREIRLVSSQLN